MPSSPQSREPPSFPNSANRSSTKISIIRYRRVLVKRYWIYYTYDAHTLTVRRVFHTMQDTDCYGFELLDD